MDSGGGPADEAHTPSSGTRPILEHGRHEMASLPIPDELMAEVLLRLPAAADLVRASAACVSFRRVAADRSFLRRYRKLHAQPLLGFLNQHKVFYPAIAPHPSAPAASAVALAADFSFSFLPAPLDDWIVRDIRDGRVLLDRPPQHDIDNRYNVVFPELVVCDPLHRRYILLPPIPDNLTATVEDHPLWLTRHRYCETFLAPSHDDEDEMSFSVIWMAQCRTKPVAFVFFSSTGQWQAIPSKSWSDLLAGSLSSTGKPLFSRRQYAYGSFYWVTDFREKLLVLDTQRMDFSIAETPSEATALALPGVATAIVEAGEGRLGMFVRQCYENCLNYTIRRISCDGSSQWKSEKTIPLDFDYFFIGSAGRHLFLYQLSGPSLDAGCFSLDVKTFQLERVFVSSSCFPNLCAYSIFPPSLLSTPTVPSGVENRAEKEMLEHGCVASSSAESPRSD
uniref:Uncharacterized protein n=1 Tax=Avena sativa TaxID=4498 RepID=A0ACD5VAH5_AVESA